MAARSSSVRGRRPSSLAGRHTTPSTCQASLRSTFLSTFMLDSFGSSASTRTKAGTHFGPRSGWLARNASNAAGSKVAPSHSSSAAITRSPTGSSGTAYTATERTSGWRPMIASTGPAAKFSPSTRSHSFDRPAKNSQPSASR